MSAPLDGWAAPFAAAVITAGIIIGMHHHRRRRATRPDMSPEEQLARRIGRGIRLVRMIAELTGIAITLLAWVCVAVLANQAFHGGREVPSPWNIAILVAAILATNGTWLLIALCTGRSPKSPGPAHQPPAGRPGHGDDAPR